MDQSPNTSALDGLLEWWNILLFAGTTFIGFILGNAKRGWTVEQLQLRLTALERELADLTRSTSVTDRAVSLLGNDIAHIRSGIADIKHQLERLQ